MSVWAGLIERLENATGPDRELDVLLLASVGWKFRTRRGLAFSHEMAMSLDGKEIDQLDLSRPTASLDAALTLVPAGVGISLVMSGSAKPYASLYSQGRGHIARASAVTLPIALCIASIKARVSHGVDEPG